MTTAPANLDHSLTFVDLQLRVCERLGIADLTGTVAAPSTDTAKIDQVKRALNDAAREFWRAVDPRTGRGVKWTFAVQTVEIAVSNDGTKGIDASPTRYRLPRGVASAPIGRMSWSDGDFGDQVWDAHIDDLIRRSAQFPSEQGPPTYAAVTHSPNPSIAPGERPPLELRIFPIPDRDCTLTGRFRMGPVQLVNDDDRGNWLADHDLTIVALAVKALVGNGGLESAPDIGTARAEATEALVASIEMDEMLRPKTAGNLNGDARRDNYPTRQGVLGDGTTVNFQ